MNSLSFPLHLNWETVYKIPTVKSFHNCLCRSLLLRVKFRCLQKDLSLSFNFGTTINRKSLTQLCSPVYYRHKELFTWAFLSTS